MKLRGTTVIKSALIALLVVFGSCSDDDGYDFYNQEPNKPPVEEEPEYDWEEIADDMQQDLVTVYLFQDGVFKESPNNSRFHYWWNAHALDVLVDGYVRTGKNSYVSRMKALVQGMEIHNGGTYNNVFVDDMEWLGMASLRAYEATGDQRFKEVAQLVWEQIQLAWSEVFGGGLQWKMDEPFGKNACSNAPGSILALRLHQVDENPEDLEWGKKIYQWQKETLVDPQTGLVWDHISLVNGQEVIKKDWIFTYNVGTYIGAGVELYEATGELVYLNDAIRSAKAVLDSGVLKDGSILKDEGQGDGGLFKGILVRYLTQLAQNPDVDDNTARRLREFLQHNAITMVEDGMLDSPKLVGPSWSKRPEGITDLSTQLSGMMLIEAVARLQE